MKKTDPQTIKTRPDLGDLEWIVWLKLQPENRGIDVEQLYRDMLDWCARRFKNPTRLRLLNWIGRERESMPMTFTPPYMQPAPEPTPEPPPIGDIDLTCEICGKDACLMLHREERGL